METQTKNKSRYGSFNVNGEAIEIPESGTVKGNVAGTSYEITVTPPKNKVKDASDVSEIEEISVTTPRVREIRKRREKEAEILTEGDAKLDRMPTLKPRAKKEKGRVRHYFENTLTFLAVMLPSLILLGMWIYHGKDDPMGLLKGALISIGVVVVFCAAMFLWFEYTGRGIASKKR